MRTREQFLKQLKRIRHDKQEHNKLPNSHAQQRALAYLRGAEVALKWALEVPGSVSRLQPKSAKQKKSPPTDIVRGDN